MRFKINYCYKNLIDKIYPVCFVDFMKVKKSSRNYIWHLLLYFILLYL